MFGAIGIAVLIGPTAVVPGRKLDLTFRDPAWEDAFLFYDSRESVCLH